MYLWTWHVKYRVFLLVSDLGCWGGKLGYVCSGVFEYMGRIVNDCCRLLWLFRQDRDWTWSWFSICIRLYLHITCSHVVFFFFFKRVHLFLYFWLVHCTVCVDHLNYSDWFESFSVTFWVILIGQWNCMGGKGRARHLGRRVGQSCLTHHFTYCSFPKKTIRLRPIGLSLICPQG